MRKRAQYPDSFMTVRNEDLNLDFVNTMRHLSQLLEIKRLESWTSRFEPTVLGRPWGGVGAYNSNTQRNKNGLLANDPEEVAKRATGPNEYVTRRWRTRMKPREIEIVERLMADELSTFGYEAVTPPLKGEALQPLWNLFMFPLSGELPKFSWIIKSPSVMEAINRTFFFIAFPIFFVATRISFLSFVKKGRVFR